ncbi:DEAD/DEAH box helicase [Candidatus Villigracilis affinis]|uniref:DEAD/DEAH box helicase n=1 Tax=Candidatus Villigracilis affinis TaxID=3140682 RepID=UPI002A232D9C|nr:DEAD/DEAH box helicase [Anaerolineales bacterium]
MGIPLPAHRWRRTVKNPLNTIQPLLDFWKRDEQTAPNFFAWKTTPPRPAQTHPIPADVPAPLREALSTRGIDQLYSHQLSAWTRSRAGENIILSTGTASGKTLAYNLPVLAAMLQDPEARAIYLFPTKALAQDQLSTLENLKLETFQLSNLPTSIYDGDTPQANRPTIRKTARIVLSNPDMLHTGILPHHANWSDFFSNLKFIVIDEAHTYRGVFGSHVANVIRRLKRVANFYGAKPQFILASATIGNPKELAERLIEEEVELIDNDGSSRGERHFIIYNPPVTDAALGLRKSSLLESVRLANDLLTYDVQSVVFARTRRSVEIILTYLQSPIVNRQSSHVNQVRGYRSGYLPHQRREIEQGLRDGSVKSVVATNALELGIDIGGLGAAILVGYPGTIASARQQSGRAGRGDDPAVSVLVASPNPLDQFLAHHPEYFFGSSPEMALVNPNHLLILLEHLRCAMFELPFKKGDGFGGISDELLDEYLEFLVANQDAHFSNEKYYWMKDQYPAANISLRSASPQSVVLQSVTEDGRPLTIGTVDGESAAWMVHPGAIYMHEAQQYFVQEFNIENHIAQLVPVGLDYYTEAQKNSEIEITAHTAQETVPGCDKNYGEIQVTTQVVGFRKIRWFTYENLGQEPLDMPPSELQTTGYWLSLSEEAVANLRDAGVWTNDPNDYGPEWPKIRDRVRARDKYQCQVCGALEKDPSTTLRARQHDVHHKTPFRSFVRNASSLEAAREQANRLENLTTLCPSCHKKVEQNVRIRSGLGGLGFVLGNLAPLFLMCDPRDLGTHTDPAWSAVNGQPSVVLYDLVPAGIGFSQKLFEIHDELIQRALELVSQCECEDGCPSCVGPGGENGAGGKAETLAILKQLTSQY